MWAVTVALVTAVLHAVAFPPFDLAEAAFVFALPLLLWSARRPPPRTFGLVLFVAFWVSWLVLLEWLRHVTWAGTIALAGVLALFPTAWALAARWAWPRALARSAPVRVAAVLGLAGAWVVLEWIRSWILTGFPWLPLAASQWQRPVMLQSAAWGGAWTVSFLLVLFNLGLAGYLARLWRNARRRARAFCPEFYLAMLALVGGSFGLFGTVMGQHREPLLEAGAMQPYIPQEVKWEEDRAPEILRVLDQQTRRVAELQPDAIFWPEAATPFRLLGDPWMQAWMERLTRACGVPLVAGAVGYEGPAAPRAGSPAVGERWWNAVFVVDPQDGLQREFYAKRHLVPFGEYVPLRRLFPFLGKFVPIGGDFTPGPASEPLSLKIAGGTVAVGALICYEDVFPGLARETVRHGADLLFVATNDAWYGETGAAYQHAAHSVLRAVETRRPVLRVGNGGWSGWIDEYGAIRDVLRDDRGSVYFRGGGAFAVTRDARWRGRESFYVRAGDWFVAISVGFALLAALALRRGGDGISVEATKARTP